MVGTEAARANLDRRVVDIEPGRPCARARRNAADADLVLTGIELHARREARQILERFDPLLVHVRLAERADADGHARENLPLASRGDDAYDPVNALGTRFPRRGS